MSTIAAAASVRSQKSATKPVSSPHENKFQSISSQHVVNNTSISATQPVVTNLYQAI